MAIGSFKPGTIGPSGIRPGGSPIDERAPIVGTLMHSDSTPVAGGLGPGGHLHGPAAVSGANARTTTPRNDGVSRLSGPRKRACCSPVP